MTKADDYNKAELAAGRLTIAHVTELVRKFQAGAGLAADGMCGPNTRRALEAEMMPAPATVKLVLSLPLPTLADGRKPQITSEFRPKDRPNHDGVDFFYRWASGDEPSFVGDKGCAGKNADGTPKWCVPYGTFAVAAAHGIVQLAGNSTTGYRCWVEHPGTGLRTGYFHLLDLKVSAGSNVRAGDPIGRVGDNPRDHDGRHLHFEVSPVDRYAPIDPAPFFAR